jgi:RND superfamily putative drug exporter
MARLLYRLGAGAARRRFLVVAVWLLVLVAAAVGAATLAGTTSNTFSIPGQESTTALSLMKERFGAASAGASAQVVLAAPEGRKLTDPALAAEVESTVRQLNVLPGVAAASDPLNPRAPSVSADQRAALSTVTYRAPAPDITAHERAALMDVVSAARAGGLSVEAGGEATQQAGGDVGGPGEIVGVVIALVVLALTYGSLVAAGMNLLTAIVGVGIGALGITTLTGFVDLSSTTPILGLMLGLAVGIDYALFIVTRFRSELRAGRSTRDAAGHAVGTAGSAVVTAGLTVVIALSGLAVAGIPFLTQMGLAAAATVVIAVLVAITLVPAVLGLIGPRALPRRARRQLAAGRGAEPAHLAGGRRGFYGGWADTVTRHRWPSLVAAVAALALIAVPFFSMRTSLAQAPAPGSTQARAQQLIDAHFGPGFSGPLLVLVDGDGAATRAAAIAQQARTLPDVAVVTPPRPNADGSSALVTLIPGSAPDSPATMDLVHTLRDRLAADTSPRAYVTGQTAVSVDVSQKLSQALPVYLALVVGLALVLLILVFRSLLVPVVGVVGFLLTIGSALGATVAVFQWGWLTDVVQASTGPLMSLAPIIVVGILFGLAMDYQVFLVSRMHEAHAHGARARDAIRTGFRQAAPVVVAAATIMFAVFAGFVPGGEATVKPIAFALALGILFDAFVVRMVIMPSALALLGESAWWLPRWLRRLPRLDVEGAGLVDDAELRALQREPIGARTP